MKFCTLYCQVIKVTVWRKQKQFYFIFSLLLGPAGAVMRRSNKNNFTHSEPSSGAEMKYLAGESRLLRGRRKLAVYYEELLPRNLQNRILFFTGVGYFKPVQSEQGSTFFQLLLINVIQIFNCWSQIMIQTRSEEIAVVNVLHTIQYHLFAYLKVTGKSVPDIWKVFIKENKNTKVILSRKKQFKLKASWMF